MKVVDIGYKFKKINDLLQKRADETMKELDVTFTQHHVLVYLIHCENHTSPLKSIEKDFKVSQATMAGIAIRLEEKGMIESYTLSSDKRIKMISLTDKGLAVCQKSREICMKSEDRIRSIYSEEEMKEFTKYLDRLYEILQKEDKRIC